MCCHCGLRYCLEGRGAQRLLTYVQSPQRHSIAKQGSLYDACPDRFDRDTHIFLDDGDGIFRDSRPCEMQCRIEKVQQPLQPRVRKQPGQSRLPQALQGQFLRLQGAAQLIRCMLK